MLTTSDWFVVGLCGFGVLLLTLFPVLSDNVTAAAYYSLILQSALAFIASLFCFSTAFAHPVGNALRTVWMVFAIGLLCWFLGNVVYFLYLLTNGSEPPLPYFSDIGFLAWVILAIVGFYLFKRTLPLSTPVWGMVLAAVIFLAGIGFSYWVGAFSGEGLGLAYVATISILAPLLSVLSILVFSSLLGSSMGSAWFVMVFGATFYYLAHFFFLYQATREIYQSGNSVVDILLTVAFLLIAVAAMMAHNALLQRQSSTS